MSKTPKQRETVAGNILSMPRPSLQTVNADEDDEAAVAYMPTDISIEKVRGTSPSPSEPADPEKKGEGGKPEAAPKAKTSSSGKKKVEPERKSKSSTRRLSLFFDDEMMLRIYKYSIEVNQDPNKALHRLIDEALKERGV